MTGTHSLTDGVLLGHVREHLLATRRELRRLEDWLEQLSERLVPQRPAAEALDDELLAAIERDDARDEGKP